ncbi:MAG: hypothetical protein AMXMBFR33_23800 [Candidatus Xenobia bacterium]
MVHVSHVSSVPPELKRLGIDPEAESASATCPECGNRYLYSYTREYDDMTLDEEYRLERLRPASDPTRLEHPDRFVRTEAAWGVCGALAEQARWEELAEMLRHPQAHVRREAVLALTEPLAPEVVEPLEENLDVPRSLTLLAHHHASNPEKLQTLLDRLGPIEQGELLICLPPEALSPFAGLARELLKGPAADRAVALLMRTGEVAATLQAIRELWTPPAARLWSYLAGEGRPVAELAPEAAARLNDRELSLPLLRGLEALSRKGAALPFVLAPLCTLLEAGQCLDLRAASWILKHEMDRGPVAPEVIASLGIMATRPRTSSDFSARLAAAARAGHDLAPALECLRQVLNGKNELARDYAAAALTAYWTAREDWAELSRLMRAHPGPCASELALQAKEHDWSPLVPQLEELVESGNSYVSGEARKALAARPS